MATDIENLRDIEYIDEDLDDIEYTEILSFEEMSKINPSFIALDKEEIYNNLYIFLKNKKKSDLLRNLFYEILINRENNNGKINDYTNYIFATEGKLEKIGDDENEKNLITEYNTSQREFLLSKFIEKYNDKSKISEFIKRKFCVSYDKKSTRIRLKPIHDTNIIITEDTQFNKVDFPEYYSIIKDYPVIKCRQIDKVENIYDINDTNDINLPIIGSYYKVPTCIKDDYMYAKVASHLLNSININYKSSANYKDIYELIKNTRPDLEMIINEINNNKDSFYLDYSNINNIFKKYDYSLDFITKKDLDILTEYMYSIIKNEKEQKNIHKGFKIKRPKLINKKLTFFDNTDNILKIINISTEIVSFLEKTKDLIIKYKSDIIYSDIEPLRSYNIYDIIKQIHENTIGIEDVIEELKLSIKTINIDNTLKTINDILEAKENIDDIKIDCDNIKKYFIHSRKHIFDYDTDGKKYIISKRENKAICDGNDIDNYEGIQDDDDIIDDDNKGVVNDSNINTIANKVINTEDLNIYLSNIKFINEKGFIEILKIILELIKKINNVANIDIDYDALSNYLFNKYRSVQTRYENYLNKFEKMKINIEDSKKYAKKYSELSPLYLYLYYNDYFNNKNIDKRHKWHNELEKAVKEQFINKTHIEIVKAVNKEFIDTFNIIFYNSICFWIVDTQSNILNNNISINLNYLNPNHIDKFNSHGLLYYITELISDFFKYNDDNDYLINIKDLRKSLIFIVENEYKDKGADILNELLNKKNMDIKNKCSTDKNKYADEELYYIDKLLFAPNNNTKYEKIHKYIQGCCLRKLNLNFNDISDFEITNNTEIIKLKEFYSKIRLINKARDVRFTPPKLIKNKPKKNKKKGKYDVDDIDNDFGIEEENPIVPYDNNGSDDIFLKEIKEKYNNIKYINNKPYIYNIKNHGVIEWLGNMRGISALLPDNLIDSIIENDIDKIDKVIIENIIGLKKVKKNIGEIFLNCKYINYKELLLNICKILYVNINSSSKFKDNDALKDKVMLSIKDIKKMISKHLYNLNKIKYDIDDIDNDDMSSSSSHYLIQKINILIISNSLNFPDLSGIENIPSEFITKKNEELYEYLKIYLEGKYNKFLTSDEIAIFINEKREEYKNKRLKENQDLDIEENEIRRQAKAAGIIKDVYNANNDNDNDNDNYNDGKKDDKDSRDDGDIQDIYKNEDKDDDYNATDNDNYNVYNDNDIDID
jgi:hypothetical protein